MIQVVLEDDLLQRGSGPLESPGAQVGHRRYLLDADAALGGALDGLEHPVLARLGQRDGHALPPRATDPSDAMHVGLDRRWHVVVDDVGQEIDVEAPGRDIGGHEQVGGAVAEALHDPVALLLGHAAVQGFGSIAAAVERLGQVVDLVPSATEHQCRGRDLYVEDPTQGRGLVPALHDVRTVADPGRLPLRGGRLRDPDPRRVAQMLPRDGVDPGGQGGGK